MSSESYMANGHMHNLDLLISYDHRKATMAMERILPQHQCTTIKLTTTPTPKI